VKSEQCKIDSLHTVKALLKRDGFMAKVDLKDFSSRIWGLLSNSKKSILEPSQEIEFLGMTVNSISMNQERKSGKFTRKLTA